MYKTLRQKKGE